MSKSNIEWTTETWNPIVGCSILSPGCTNCYAMKMAARIEKMREAMRPDGTWLGPMTHYAGTTKKVNGHAVWTGKLAMAGDHILLAPLKRKKPTTYFVNSMSDLFHENVPDEWIDRVFAVMALSPQHTFQVLTKRAGRMRDYCAAPKSRAGDVAHAGVMLGVWDDADHVHADILAAFDRGPLSNVWLGVSTERQQEADERIPLLLQTPAAVRFISAEPLLGAIDLTRVRALADPHAPDEEWLFDSLSTGDMYEQRFRNSFDETWYDSGDGPYRETKLDWVIAGGESGPDARPMHPDWARRLRDDCKAAGVPFFLKQWGEWAPQLGAIDLYEFGEVSRRRWVAWDGEDWDYWDRPAWCDDIGAPEDCLVKVGKKSAGRLLDGVEHNEMPGGAR